MIHLWYSGATDITGKAIAAQLDIEAGTRGNADAEIVIGWGCKTEDNVSFRNGITVINHPDRIRDNRDKLKTLCTLTENARIENAIAKYIVSDRVIEELNQENIELPLIGRTRRHQGGKGFWFCPTKTAVIAARREGAKYFQQFINIKQEYRLHVFDGKVIYAQKKIENPSEDTWIAQRTEKINNFADKHNVSLDENTLNYTLKRLVKEVALPDRIVRSNKRGWKFSTVRTNSVATVLKNIAIDAVVTVGLDFGAVDCAIGQDNTPWIIEINSGPGLQRGSLDAYVAAFRNKIDEITNQRIGRGGVARDARGRFIACAVGGQIQENRNRARAVGAAAANRNDDNDGIARIMQNVRNDEEARAVIDAILRGDV